MHLYSVHNSRMVEFCPALLSEQQQSVIIKVNKVNKTRQLNLIQQTSCLLYHCTLDHWRYISLGNYLSGSFHLKYF